VRCNTPLATQHSNAAFGTIDVNRQNRVAVVTLGCKINTLESATMAQLLVDDNWQLVDSNESADLYLINSCTVTAEADRQTRQAVRRVLRNNPNAKVVLTGCYAQNEPEECAALPGVSIVLGNDQKSIIAPFVRSLKSNSNDPSPVYVDRLTGLPATLLRGFEGQTRAFVQVQQGCDQGCTFCVIHRARGRSISLNEDAILNQVRTFVASGSSEIVVCGVDLGSYEYSSSDGEVDALNLVSLLKKISRLPGEFRIRLSSIDPAHLNDSLLDLMGSDERFCPYLHVSVQSGSTLILKRMKRRYDREWLLERLFAARERLPGLVLGADIMAGFPTETEADFAQSLSVIKDAEIIYPHVFPFSARPGTPAARIPRQVAIPERRRRAAEMRQAGQTVRNRALEGMVGRKGQLLIERPVVSGKSGAYHGRLENYMPVQVKRLNGGSGDIVPIQVDSVESDVLIAHMLGSE